jgi:hypothetical protein
MSETHHGNFDFSILLKKKAVPLKKYNHHSNCVLDQMEGFTTDVLITRDVEL